MRQTNLQCTALGIMGNREQWGESPFDFNRIYLEGWTDIYIYIYYQSGVLTSAV